MHITKRIVKQSSLHTEKVVWMPAKVVSVQGLFSLGRQPFSLSQGIEKERFPHLLVDT
jgi:hypothetical protein